MDKKFLPLLLIVPAIGIIAAVIGYRNFAADRQPYPSATPTPQTMASESQILERLALDWPSIEQGPLKHSGESGHWFLNYAQFIAADRLVVYYEDGLVDRFSALTYADGSFQVEKSFPAFKEELASTYAAYGNPQYARSTYAYDNDTRTFTRAAGATIFDRLSSAGTPAPTGQQMAVKIALLNPDQTLPNQVKPGDIAGCDHVVLVDRTTASTPAPLTAALRLLLAERTVWSENNKLYNYLGQGSLSLQSATIQNGVAKVYLTGTRPPLGGVCDDPRLFVQIAQTARQFATVKTVEVYINGVRNTWGEQGG